jgi:choline-sulfatase
VIITSDHGQLFERGIHGHLTATLYDPVIQVPMLISRPGNKQRQDVYSPTSCVDLVPTLLHLAGKSIPDWCEGRILPSFGNSLSDPARWIYALEAKSNPKTGPLEKYTAAMIGEQYKLISYFGYGRLQEVYELYDLYNDPEERQNLSKKEPRLLADLKGELAATLRQKDQ